MNWELIREHGHTWYLKSARFFLFQNIVLYLFGCIAAHGPIGLPAYIEFLYRCSHWMER